MSQAQDTGAGAIVDTLRAAASLGQQSLLHEIRADAVLLHKEHVLPELLRICTINEAGQNLAFLNAVWKLLLSVASLRVIEAPVFGDLLQFMLLQLQQHVFSHDWSDGRKTKLSIFLASHVVSAVRAHSFYVACSPVLVKTIADIYFIACLTVATSGRREAALRLHQGIVVRLLAIFEALGSATSTLQQPILPETHLQLLLSCLDGQPCGAVAELPSLFVTTGSSVAALALMLAAAQPLHLSDSAYLETLMAAFLLWVPDMQLALYDVCGQEGKVMTEGACGERSAVSLCCLVVQHARNLPRSVFFANHVDADVAQSLGEVNLSTQLLLLLRNLACRCVDAVLCEGWRDVGAPANDCGVGGGSLLRCRVFGLLLTALMVPNDASVAFVLLVWEAVLSRLSYTVLKNLGTELQQLCKEQFSALCGLVPVSADGSDETEKWLRRFLNAIAVLLAEIRRLLRCASEKVFDTPECLSPTCVSSESGCLVDYLVDFLYHQACLYQWWNEKTVSEEVVICGTGAESALLQDELQAMLAEWKKDFVVGDGTESGRRYCAIIISIPGRVKNILENATFPLTIASLLLLVTRVLHGTVENMGRPFSRALCVCARFVAAELVALMGFVPSDDPTLLACVRRLVDISFGAAESSEEVRVKGMLQYHAAVCLRNFIQRNTVVSPEKLRLSETLSATLMSLLQGGVVGDAVVDMRDCEGLLASQVDAWEALLLRCVQAVASSQTNGSMADLTLHGSPCFSSQNATDIPDGGFFLPLQQCEGTVRSVLRCIEAGRSLQPLEEEALARLERLVRVALSTAGRPTPTATTEPTSSLDTVSADVQMTAIGPEIIMD